MIADGPSGEAAMAAGSDRIKGLEYGSEEREQLASQSRGDLEAIDGGIALLSRG